MKWSITKIQNYLESDTNKISGDPDTATGGELMRCLTAICPPYYRIRHHVTFRKVLGQHTGNAPTPNEVSGPSSLKYYWQYLKNDDTGIHISDLLKTLSVLSTENNCPEKIKPLITLNDAPVWGMYKLPVGSQQLEESPSRGFAESDWSFSGNSFWPSVQVKDFMNPVSGLQSRLYRTGYAIAKAFSTTIPANGVPTPIGDDNDAGALLHQGVDPVVNFEFWNEPNLVQRATKEVIYGGYVTFSNNNSFSTRSDTVAAGRRYARQMAEFRRGVKDANPNANVWGFSFVNGSVNAPLPSGLSVAQLIAPSSPQADLGYVIENTGLFFLLGALSENPNCCDIISHHFGIQYRTVNEPNRRGNWNLGAQITNIRSAVSMMGIAQKPISSHETVLHTDLGSSESSTWVTKTPQIFEDYKTTQKDFMTYAMQTAQSLNLHSVFHYDDLWMNDIVKSNGAREGQARALTFNCEKYDLHSAADPNPPPPSVGRQHTPAYDAIAGVDDCAQPVCN